jgi:hypothetical protein
MVTGSPSFSEKVTLALASMARRVMDTSSAHVSPASMLIRTVRGGAGGGDGGGTFWQTL